MITKKGFSLSELIVALVIVGAISILLIPNLFDTSNDKLNEAVAQKAEFDVKQAALRLQAECPRFRCVNPLTSLQELMPGDSDIVTYYFNDSVAGEISVIVDIDSDNTSNLAFTLNRNGTVDDDCTVEDYKAGKSCDQSISNNNYNKRQ